MEEQRVCSMCGCILGENEGTELDDDLLCNDCVEQHTVQCDHCGETVWVEDSVSDERTVLCCSCFDDHYRRCEDCGRILHDSDVLWHNDYAYCEHCYDRIDTEIEEYGYKPEPVFYGEGNRFFGVELEIDLAGKDRGCTGFGGKGIRYRVREHPRCHDDSQNHRTVCRGGTPAPEDLGGIFLNAPHRDDRQLLEQLRDLPFLGTEQG